MFHPVRFVLLLTALATIWSVATAPPRPQPMKLPPGNAMIAELGDARLPPSAVGISEGSEAYFQERCKLSGERVFKPLTKERGIELLRMRHRVDTRDQWSAGDPFGDASSDDSYIHSFISWRDSKGLLTHTNPLTTGFDFVDVAEAYGLRVRYTAAYVSLVSKWAEPGSLRFKAEKDLAPRTRAKYGVTFQDISTVDDRRRWIAGGTMRLIELDTGDVVAERTGFMMDPNNGAGFTNGWQPWARAPRLACPAYPVSSFSHQPSPYGITRNWVESLLLN